MGTPQEKDIERLTLPFPVHLPTPKGKPRHRRGKKFLRGPISWDWLIHASQLPGKSLHVAISCWRWAGIKKTRRVKLSWDDLRAMGIGRTSVYRALRHLERAALISVERKRGASPIVTLLEK